MLNYRVSSKFQNFRHNCIVCIVFMEALGGSGIRNWDVRKYRYYFSIMIAKKIQSRWGRSGLVTTDPTPSLLTQI